MTPPPRQPINWRHLVAKEVEIWGVMPAKERQRRSAVAVASFEI